MHKEGNGQNYPARDFTTLSTTPNSSNATADQTWDSSFGQEHLLDSDMSTFMDQVLSANVETEDCLDSASMAYMPSSAAAYSATTSDCRASPDTSEYPVDLFMSRATRGPDECDSSSSGASCQCLVQAIRTHETIEITLGYASQNPADTTEALLQQQKRCLKDCEALVNCSSCQDRSDYIMLILSMCRKITTSLVGSWSTMMTNGPWPDPVNGRSRTLSSSPLSARTQISRMQSERNGERRPGLPKQTVHPAGHFLGSAAQFMDANQQRRGSLGYDDRLMRRGLEIGLWKLDDDDELHVLQSLLMARITRLGALLDSLEDLITQHTWPAHRRVIQDLQGCFESTFKAPKGTANRH